MTLEEFTNSLPKDKQLKLALHFARLALPVWEDYCADRDISYRDTVVGMTHSTDKNLPRNVLNAIEEYLNMNKWQKFLNGKKNILKFRSQFDEPIVALQDEDWQLPYEVKTTFYAFYNLTDAVIGKDVTVFGDSTIYVSINQAIDALETSGTMSVDEINRILQKYSDEI